jgi:hypothetical protein
MTRIFSAITFLLALLVLFALHFSASSGLTRQASAATSLRASASPAEAPSLKIVFRGLMVFHSDPASQYFEVGVVKAPEHEFRLQVIENSPEGVSSSLLPVAPSGSEVWSLEFPSQTSGVSFYQNGSFDRKSGVGDDRDFRWLIDLHSKEFFHRGLQTDRDQLGIVLRVASGEFYTNKRTPPLMRKNASSAFENFGPASQEVATDASLKTGDLVLRSEKTGAEILRLKDKPDTGYEVIIDNAFVPHTHMTPSADHFQYYYQLFGIPKTEWYEFKPGNRTIISRSTDSLGVRLVRANYVNTDEAPCMPVSW